MADGSCPGEIRQPPAWHADAGRGPSTPSDPGLEAATRRRRWSWPLRALTIGRRVTRYTPCEGSTWARPGECGQARSDGGRAEAPSGTRPRQTPALKKGEEGTPKMELKGRPACGVPAVLSPRPHRTGRFQPPRPPLFGDPLRGRPLRSGLRGAFSALRARPARSGRGADVFGPSRRRLTAPFEKKPCSRGGRPSRTPPSARRGTASPPPA